MFANKLLTYLTYAHLKKVKGKSSTYYFYMKANILADFQICISVPLSASLTESRIGSTLDLIF